MTSVDTCLFCKIASGQVHAEVVFSDETTLAFLDHRPVFKGHALLIPKQHYPTFADLTPMLLAQISWNAQRLAAAVERGAEAQGTFVGLNNKISQSVPHLHVHIVPRRKGDGLRGFFWPRTKYESPDEMADFAARIRAALRA
jgi:histidine triad (HIT) family protein